MTQRVSKLQDFLEDFVDEHSTAGEDELLLDVTPEEVEDLGRFFVRGICGWMHGLRVVRQKKAVARAGTDDSQDSTEEGLEDVSDVESELAH